jgi:hypothetical protein
VSVKTETKMEASICAERNFGATSAVCRDAISRKPSRRVGSLAALPEVRSGGVENYSGVVVIEPTHALRKWFLADRISLGPNQSSEPTRPIVRFITVKLHAKDAGYSGLVAHL